MAARSSGLFATLRGPPAAFLFSTIATTSSIDHSVWQWVSLLRAVFLFLASGEAFPQAGDLEKNLAPHGVFDRCSLGPSLGGPLPEVFSAILLRVVHDAAV